MLYYYQQMNMAAMSDGGFDGPDLGSESPSDTMGEPEDFTSDNATGGEDAFTDEEFAEFEDNLS